MKYKIGQTVHCNAGKPRGLNGFIIAIDTKAEFYLIQFDDFDGHNGNCKYTDVGKKGINSNCWWTEERNIEAIDIDVNVVKKYNNM